MFKWINTLILALVTTQALAAANITAHLNRNPVSLNESFHLVYEADSFVDDPDFSVLSKDFEILSSSQSTNMRAVGGSWSLKKSWDLTLISRQAGVYTIPPVPFGNDLAPSIRITVNDAAAGPAPGGAPSQGRQGAGAGELFLEAEVDSRSVYVQSQIVYTVRLVRTVDINNATLTEPLTSDSNALIERLGEDVNYDRVVSGVRYSVIERKYAIFPQTSGKLTIKPVTFKGRVLSAVPTRPRSMFDSFMNMNTGSYKQVMSRSLSIDVQPRPDGIDAAGWLPAKDLELIQQWSHDITQLKSGEPVTRTLTLRADGLMAEQLPGITVPEIDGIKQYPDMPALENTVGAEGVRGTREIKIAMIPTRMGSFVVPEITLNWWNTETGRPETITLPASTLTAATAADATLQPQQPPLADVRLARAGDEMTADSSRAAPASAPLPENPWFWVSAALACGWLASTLLVLRRTTPERAARPLPATPDPAPARKAVLAALGSSDRHAAKDALLAWGRALWHPAPVGSLADLAGRIGDRDVELADRLRELNASLYSNRENWSASALMRAFQSYKPEKPPKRQAQDTALEPLFRA